MTTAPTVAPGEPATRSRRRARLSVRIALLGVAVAVLTATVSGALSIGLIRAAGDEPARTALRRLADVAQTVADRPARAQLRLRAALNGLKIRIGELDTGGTLTASAPLVTNSVTPTDIDRVLAGHDVDRATSSVLVEGRPARSGGVFLVQRRDDAVSADRRAIRRILLGLLIGGVVAAGLGLAVAARLSRPLRRTARAAHALADGARDVSVPVEGPAEVAEVGEAINVLASALRSSEGRQRDFLLSVSHDLRTPLTAISGYAESLADGVVPGEEAAAVGAVMLDETRRLQRMVADLLDLARLDAQDVRVEVSRVDLTALVDAAANAWTERCAQVGVLLRREHGGGALVVDTDPGRLRQALDGLVENALRVTPAGAPIVLATRNEAGAQRMTAVVEVRDGGPGLTDDDVTVAFRQGELHRRYRGVRQVGTGLGLAIVHRLVTRLGGTIAAGRAPEGGAAFTIRLPVP
ncbi:MAG: ATP-binding protein [Jatrophihabitans sp.]|uniref:HAMP domain-containing sensor histidine kinase n=1 Tax=Jatrophihabitans sp. TaxID=1932789 RepID=UPI003F800121